MPKIYHPFISGPENRYVKELQERTGARISIPPLSVMKDELAAVSGEKEGVQIAAAHIKSIWKDMVRYICRITKYSNCYNIIHNIKFSYIILNSNIFSFQEGKCRAISVEVRKSQHKYVIGPRGINLNEILEQTGVSVEVPSVDSESDTITLRGEQAKLGIALTQVYAKANSIIISHVQAPGWVHRFIIGRKGTNINKITQEYPKVYLY